MPPAIAMRSSRRRMRRASRASRGLRTGTHHHMPDGPIENERGELQPDPAAPSGDTPAHRADAERIEEHSRDSTAPTDPDATRPDPDVS